jgi:malate synthase
LKRPALTTEGVEPAQNADFVKAGTRFMKDLFEKVWQYHNEWTAAFFEEQDRRGDPGRFDRSKAPIIMELLRRQLLSPRYIQHSARVLFILAEADERRRKEILEAIFDRSRDEIKDPALRKAYDYVYDIVDR